MMFYQITTIIKYSPYCLDTKGFFGEEIKSSDIEQDENQKILEIPSKSALLVGDTIKILVDTSNQEAVIQIGKFLHDDEQEDHAILLHEFPEIFSRTY